MLISFSRSPCIILDTGMPVARDTTSAISSAPTWVRSNLFLTLVCSALSAWCNSVSSAGNLPYWSSANLSNWPFLCRSAICMRIFSISSRMCAVPCTCAFSTFQISSRSEYSFSSRRISSSIKLRRFFEESSFSFFTASRSIFS